MSDFKAEMHLNRFRLGLCPRPHWGSLQRSPRPPSWNKGNLLLREGEDYRKGKAERGRGKGREGTPRVYLQIFLTAVYIRMTEQFLTTS